MMWSGIGRLRSCFKWGWPLLIGLMFVGIGLTAFAGLALRVVRQDAFGFDRAVMLALSEVASPGLTQFMLFASDSATALFLIPLLLLLAALWWRKYRYDWVALAVSLVGASLLNQFAKGVFERTRPDLFEHLQQAGGYSFPSGHSQTAVAFYGVLAYLVARHLPPRWRIPVYLAGGLWAIAIGLSRNYLGVHFPSDVLAAFAITIPWILAVIFVHQCYAPSVMGEEKVIKPKPEAEPVDPGRAE